MLIKIRRLPNRRRRRVQKQQWNDESGRLWILPTGPTRDDGSNDDDASQHGSNGGNDAANGRGKPTLSSLVHML